MKNYDICEKCGTHQQIDEMSKFCIYCGSELNHPYRQRLNFIYDKKPSILVAMLAKIAKIDNKPIDRELAKFISMLIDKINIFYDIADSEFRLIYADIFEYEKNGGRSTAELCNQLTLSNEKEGEFILMLFFDLIYFDGVMTSKEEFLMEQIAVALGIGVLNFRELRDMFEAKHTDNFESKDLPSQYEKQCQNCDISKCELTLKNEPKSWKNLSSAQRENKINNIKEKPCENGKNEYCYDVALNFINNYDYDKAEIYAKKCNYSKNDCRYLAEKFF